MVLKLLGAALTEVGAREAVRGGRRKADVWLHLLFCNVGENCLLSSGLVAPRS